LERVLEDRRERESVINAARLNFAINGSDASTGWSGVAGRGGDGAIDYRRRSHPW
jgi:hypothetical protein